MSDIYRVACIGGGHIADALLLPQLALQDRVFTVVDPDQSVQEKWRERGVHCTAELSQVVDCMILAVRPAHLKEVARHWVVDPEQVAVVSVAAGVSCETLCHLFSLTCCVRAMPNIAATIGQGVIGLYVPDACSQRNRVGIQQLFKPLGTVLLVSEESQLDVIAAVSGSGPAYIFALLDCWCQSACALGLSAEEALQIVWQTAQGSLALMPTAPHRTFSDWCDAVASRGGMTERALTFLKTDKMQEAWMQALQAAHSHAQAMGHQVTMSMHDQAGESK